MGFLSGSIGYECFRTSHIELRHFGPEHVETLTKYAISSKQNLAAEQTRAGFLAGDHLFDRDFDLAKNILNDALHFAMRIDSNQIPAAIRKAWLQMELAVFRAEAPERRPTKAERQEAKDAVEARCEEAARNGQFQKMQQFPILWDARHGQLYFGGSSPSAGEACRMLLKKAFELELEPLSASRLAIEWAVRAKRRRALGDVTPARFRGSGAVPSIQWWNGQADNFDFLGNEFLLWLWWHWETQSDQIELPDGTEVTGMFAHTLSLQCPLGESGKGTITAEGPTNLPEAMQAIRSGKLPRKAGLTLVRQGEQYDVTLQAESFAVSGAKIHVEEKVDGRGAVEDRIDSLRGLNDTVVLLFQAFCSLRVSKRWPHTLSQLRRWLKAPASKRKGTPATEPEPPEDD